MRQALNKQPDFKKITTGAEEAAGEKMFSSKVLLACDQVALNDAILMYPSQVVQKNQESFNAGFALESNGSD